MFTFYAICAAIGCTLMLVQFIMSLLGLAHDGDVHMDGHIDVDGFSADVGDGHFGADVHVDAVDAHFDAAHAADATGDHSASWFFGVLSFRSLVAAVAFFGLMGLVGDSAAWPVPIVFFAATGSGAAAMVIVAWLMRTLYRLRSEGNVRIENAVGCAGNVYLTIPANRDGAGKVTIKVQGRTMEYKAMTADSALPTGTPIVVFGVIGSDILEVVPATTTEGD